MVFRIAILILWLLSSVGGLTYALFHYIPGRKQWAAKKWRGDPDENAARFWRLSARALLGYFILAVNTGLVALLWPTPPQPLTLRGALNTFQLIIANLFVVWLVRLLRDYGKNTQAKSTSDEMVKEILDQFTADSGANMRDAVDRLEVVAAELRRLVIELGEKADVAAAASRAAAAAAKVIAKNLELAKEKVEAVEADLAEAHRRADAVEHDGKPGEAADAASRMTKAEKEALEEEQDNPDA